MFYLLNSRIEWKCVLIVLKQQSNFDLTECARKEVDHYGGDVRREAVNNYRECGNRCQSYKDCQKWTLQTMNNTGQCHLKSKDRNMLGQCKNCFSGFKSSEDKQCSMDGKFINYKLYLF